MHQFFSETRVRLTFWPRSEPQRLHHGSPSLLFPSKLFHVYGGGGDTLLLAANVDVTVVCVIMVTTHFRCIKIHMKLPTHNALFRNTDVVFVLE